MRCGFPFALPCVLLLILGGCGGGRKLNASASGSDFSEHLSYVGDGYRR